MTDVQYLEELIRRSGKKKGYLAKKLNLSYSGFFLKCCGKNAFTPREIKNLCRELDVNDLEEREKIFFN